MSNLYYNSIKNNLFPKKLLLLSVLFIFLGFSHCASIEKIEGSDFVSEPTTIPENSSLEKPDLPLSADDYKSRKKPKSISFYSISPIVFPGNIPISIQSLLKQEIKIIWKTNSSKEVSILDSLWENKQLLKEEFKSGDIDAVIDTEVSFEKNKLSMIQKVTDPINGREFGTAKIIYEIIFPSTEKETVNRVEIYKDKNSFKVIRNQKIPDLKLEESPSQKTLESILKKSISTKINVYSTSADTALLVDGKTVGILPLKDLTIADGEHELEFQKPGYESFKRIANFRSSEPRDFYHEWDDDLNFGSLSIKSYPEGFKVSKDNLVIGETPYNLYGLSPSKSNIEISRNFPEKGDLVIFKFPIEIKPKSITSVFLPVEMDNALDSSKLFWKEKLTNNLQAKFQNGLSINSSEPADSKEWIGLYSEPIIPGSMIISGGFFNPEDTGDGIGCFSIVTPGKTYMLETEKDRVSLFVFPEKKAIVSYKFKKDDSIKERTFKFEFNSLENKLKVELGNKMIYESQATFSGTWNLALYAKGKLANKFNLIKSLAINYPALVPKKK